MNSENTTDQALLSRSDLWEAFVLCLFALPAFFMTERVWMAIARGAARVRVLAGKSQFRRQAQEIAPAFARLGIASTPDNTLKELVANEFLRYFIMLREHSPWGWNPAIRVVGLENLAEAKQDGRGVVLYVYPSVHYAILSKKAIALSGTRATHLSRDTHGFSPTRFGVRFLNPVAARVENRYIARRLVLEQGKEAGALRGLIEALRGQEVVMVTANAEGRAHELDFLVGKVRLARGAVAIGISSGAPVLPVMAAREGHGQYVVEIGPRLSRVGRGGGPEAEKMLLREYLERLEGFVTRYPSQCCEWRNRNRWQPGK